MGIAPSRSAPEGTHAGNSRHAPPPCAKGYAAQGFGAPSRIPLTATCRTRPSPLDASASPLSLPSPPHRRWPSSCTSSSTCPCSTQVRPRIIRRPRPPHPLPCILFRPSRSSETVPLDVQMGFTCAGRPGWRATVSQARPGGRCALCPTPAEPHPATPNSNLKLCRFRRHVPADRHQPGDGQPPGRL